MQVRHVLLLRIQQRNDHCVCDDNDQDPEPGP